MKRLRVHYAKRGPLAFVPHVELPPLFCRAARRAGLIPSLTEGLSPHPRVVLGPPLPMGVLGLDEPADLWFDDLPEGALEKWRRAFPEGLTIHRVDEIGDGPALSRLCQGAVHRLLMRHPVDRDRLAAALRDHCGQALLGLHPVEDQIEVILADPNRFGPGAIVKALAGAGLIAGWQDLLIVRTAVGAVDGATVVPLWAGR